MRRGAKVTGNFSFVFSILGSDSQQEANHPDYLLAFYLNQYKVMLEALLYHQFNRHILHGYIHAT